MPSNRVGTKKRTGTGAASAVVEILERGKLSTPRNDLWGDRRLDMYRDEAKES